MTTNFSTNSPLNIWNCQCRTRKFSPQWGVFWHVPCCFQPENVWTVVWMRHSLEFHSHLHSLADACFHPQLLYKKRCTYFISVHMIICRWKSFSQVLKEIPLDLQQFTQDYSPFKTHPAYTHAYLAYPLSQYWLYVFPVWSICGFTEMLSILMLHFLWKLKCFYLLKGYTHNLKREGISVEETVELYSRKSREKNGKNVNTWKTDKNSVVWMVYQCLKMWSRFNNSQNPDLFPPNPLGIFYFNQLTRMSDNKEKHNSVQQKWITN